VARHGVRAAEAGEAADSPKAYLPSLDAQFMETLMGAELDHSMGTFTRKRWPSGVTSNKL
jgi:hypothetical protein